MGAVQKLATVVIVGLVGLATLLVVYLADEPNRREAEAEEQQEVAIERGIDLFLANCIQCHGPGGEGASAGDGRIGMALGGNTQEGHEAQLLNQSEDPTIRQERYDLIVSTINNGRGLMPAFGRGAAGGALLNDEQIYELATMIQNVDWDVVYNHAIEESGGMYPTPPPPPAPPGSTASESAADPEGEQAPSGTTIEGFDIGWTYNGESTAPGKPITVTVAPGTTISLPNVGASLHNFSVDAFGIDVDMPAGETVEAQIPADAAPGEYEFYCNVPGHKQAGMVGTLVIDPNAAAPAGGAPSEGTPPADAAAPAEAAAVDLEGFDIGWTFDGQSTTPGNPITMPVAAGTTINLVNTGASAHDFSVDALGINVEMPPAETVQAQIPADAAPGEYEFYCSVPGHKQAGMVGTLVIQ